MLFFAFLACTDYGLAQLDTTTHDPVEDTASPPKGATNDSAHTALTDDTGAQDDTATPVDTAVPGACVPFEFCWTSFMQGDLRIEGEFQDTDGVVVTVWQTWAQAEDTTQVCYSWNVCPGAARFRGEGVARLDADTTDDSWACTRSSSGEFTLTGLTEFVFDGQAVPPEVVADPTSDGCGVAATLPWPE